MRETDFLERLTIAQKTWESEGHRSNDVSEFIAWLYQQYGIIQPK